MLDRWFNTVCAHVHEGEYKNYRQIEYMDERHKTYRVAQKLSHYRNSSSSFI